MYALVDGNSFYASCEQIFRPDLTDKPVVVLSNNDGCIVARNAQAKALGIPDLVPYFQQKDVLHKHGVHVFSSNYELYGDISRRMMDILGSMVGDIEIYSIDEAFLRLLSTTKDYTAFGHILKDRVARDLGMPVCAGIAPTKTLAKLANRAAKKIPALKGVCAMDTQAKRDWVLKRFETRAIWGVGARISARLAEMGIHTAYQLAQTSSKHLRKQFSVVLERTVRELNGEPCIPFDEEPAPKKEIICSRSFSRKLTDCAELQQAMSKYADRACEKLRQQDGLTAMFMVFVESSRFKGPQYANQKVVKLDRYTNDTRVISAAASQAAGELFRSNIPFHKCGILLMELKKRRPEQLHFFTPRQSAESRRLMDSLDAVNRRFGRGTLTLANQGLNPSWKMARGMMSPRYTTDWKEIPVVRA